MYFIITMGSSGVRILNTKHDKTEAWNAMRDAVINELVDRNDLDTRDYDISKILQRPGDSFNNPTRNTHIDPITENSAIIFGDGYLTKFYILSYSDDKIASQLQDMPITSKPPKYFAKKVRNKIKLCQIM